MDESELNLDKVEEEMAADYSDEEEDEILHIDDLQLAAVPGAESLEMAKPSEILASTTDAEAWNLEVERVAPKLKVTVRVDGRDWRSHLEQVTLGWPPRSSQGRKRRSISEFAIFNYSLQYSFFKILKTGVIYMSIAFYSCITRKNMLRISMVCKKI